MTREEIYKIYDALTKEQKQAVAFFFELCRALA